MMDFGLYQLKYPVRRLIAGVLPLVRGVDPNIVSWCILPVGIGTAICYFLAPQHPFLFLGGPLLILLRMFLATLDGLMAATFNKSSPRGELANRVPAEISDILLMIALALSPGHMRIGIATMAIGWLTTFTGLVGLTAGKPTQSVGPVGQTDRLTALMICSFAGFFANLYGCHADLLLYFLWWTCIGGSITIALRLWRIF